MEFPWIRLCGTLGFIVPAYLIEFWWLRGLTGSELEQARAIAFTLSGIVGVAMAAYCLTLPHTPPERQERNYAPGIVVGMLRNRDFLVLVLVSFLIAIAHQFVVVWYSPFMRDILDSGGWGAYEQSISSIGQVCELAVLFGLGLLIKTLGFKRTMLLGTGAYLLRCLLFALVFSIDASAAQRVVIAAAGQALHGFCFGCFMAVGYMYVDRIAPADVRGSMQTLYGVFVLSLGFFVGGFVGGMIGEIFSAPVGDATQRDWTSIWLSCAAICAVCVVVFGLFFPDRRPERTGERGGLLPSANDG
jgi:MFS family permease